MSKNDHLNVVDISTLLSVNEETVRRWIRNDILTANKNLGRYGSSVKRVDFIDFLNKNPKFYKNCTPELREFIISNNIEPPCEVIEISDKVETKNIPSSLKEIIDEDTLKQKITELTTELKNIDFKLNELNSRREKLLNELRFYKHIEKM